LKATAVNPTVWAAWSPDLGLLEGRRETRGRDIIKYALLPVKYEYTVVGPLG